MTEILFPYAASFTELLSELQVVPSVLFVDVVISSAGTPYVHEGAINMKLLCSCSRHRAGGIRSFRCTVQAKTSRPWQCQESQ
eukprot:5610239-Amphidinium_carterae.1